MKSDHEANIQARSLVFNFLYQVVKNKKKFDELDEMLAELGDFEETYTEQDDENPNNQLTGPARFQAQEILKSWFHQHPAFEEKIRSLSTTKNLDELILVICQMAMAEHKLGKTPRLVIINESVTMAKRYGPTGSHTFVNAILDKAL
jgi:transcription termination factor NusB